MLPSGHSLLLRCFAPLVVVLALAAKANAQEQERKLIDRIMHPNMELHAEGFEKTFETKATTGDKQAAVRSFAFAGRTADSGTFHARTFTDGRGTFRTENYAVKRATAADQHAPQADRTFATGAVPVREDRMANRSAGSSDRSYNSSAKPYLVPGKRQDFFDDLLAQKGLSIEQVRDILNKNK